ncbi:MAG: Uma2 family endonuclease [Saprospiraceae bacterium]
MQKLNPLNLKLHALSLPEIAHVSKLEEYIANGCRLGWLVDAAKKQTMVYRPDGSVQVVSFDQKLDGGKVLPGLELTMAEVLAD